MKNEKLELQLRLNRAKATDIEVLKKYREREVVIGAKNKCYGGTISDVGSEFIYLTHCKAYGFSLKYSEENPRKLQHFLRVPERTLSISQIEEIVLLEDIKDKEK